MAFAEAVAGGELDRSLDIRSGDEVGMLASALRHMVGNLREMDRVQQAQRAGRS